MDPLDQRQEPSGIEPPVPEPALADPPPADPPPQAKTAPSRCEHSGAASDRACLALAKRHKTMALQAALLRHGAEPAMILVVLALMGASATVRIRRSRQEAFDDHVMSPEVQAVFDKYRTRFAGCLEDGSGDAESGRGLRLRYWDEDCQVAAFRVLCGLARAEMHELFTAFVASSLKSAGGCAAALGDAALAAALAAETDAHAARHWRVDEAYLSTCSKHALIRFALRVGVLGEAPSDIARQRLRKLTSEALRCAILDYLAAHPETEILPPGSFRFGTREQLAALATGSASAVGGR